MDLRSLRYFVAVAEEKSVGKAARRLNMAQPPLSVHIRNLEETLGTPLFRRASRGMEITDAGTALLSRAQAALLLAHEGFEAARAVGSGQRGRLTVGVMFALAYEVLPRLAPELRRRLPHVEVSYLELSAATSAEAVMGLEATVALCMPPIARDGIATERIGREPLMIALPADSPLARLRSVPVDRLQGLPQIGLPKMQEGVELSVAASMLRRLHVTMPIAHRVGTVHSALALVMAGEGLALLPACAALGRPPGVVFRPLKDIDDGLDVAVCWRRDLDNPLIAPFLDCARAALAYRSAALR